MARVDTITPEGKAGAQIDQPQGRDLCDPSVPDSVRRAAGVDCGRELSINGKPARPGLAKDSLLTPKDKAIRDDFDSLDLGDDVPATIILQQ